MKLRAFATGLLSALWLTFASVAHGAVSAQLSATDIDELESVRLTIRASNTRQTETLDLSPLEADFEVMGTNTSSQYRFVQGREQSWVDYQITLQPRRTGTLTIPSIDVAGGATPTLTLRVRPLASDTRDAIRNMVFFETEISEQRVYVQAQLLFTRRLLYTQGVQLYSDLPGEPEIEDAVVLTLGETISGTTRRNGQTYGVVEQRYAIFPESSGGLTIPAIAVTASVRLVENNRVSRKGVRVTTDPLPVDVMPVPPDYPTDEPWLPAREVHVQQIVTPETPAEVGDTLTHELLIHIRGNVGSIAPPKQLPEIDTFRAYPQSPVIQDDANGDMITGTRLQTQSIVPLSPGRLVLPEVRVFWWDTEADQMRIATGKPVSLSVAGDAITEPAEAPTEVAPSTPSSKAATPPLVRQPRTPWIFWIVGLMLILIVGVVFWQRSRGTPHRGSPTTSREALRAALKASTSADDLVRRGRDYLAAVNISVASFRSRSSEHEMLWARASESAYGSGTAQLNETDRERLVELLVGAGERRQSARAKSTSALPPLYPHEAHTR